MLTTILAAAAAKNESVLDKIKSVPTQTWINVGIVIISIVVIVQLWKILKNVNMLAPYIVMVLVGGSVILYWTYERTEPKILTPVINVLSEFLPSKDIAPKDPTKGM